MISVLVAAILFAPPNSAVAESSTPADTSVTEVAESELAAAKQAFLDARKNKGDLEKASFQYGEVVVNSPVLGAKDKYPLALALFRQALAINPQNEPAKEWEGQIIAIYQSLGREPSEVDLNTIR